MTAATNIKLVRPEPLAEALRCGELAEFKSVSPFAACLMPLLEVLNWRGSLWDVAEALPHFAATLDLTDLRNAMVTLGYDSEKQAVSLADLDPRLMPCLFVTGDARPYVIVGADGDRLHAFDGLGNEWIALSPDRIRGTAFYFAPAEHAAAAAPWAAGAGPWFGKVAGRLAGISIPLLAMTLLLNILTLGVPLFIMLVYDKVIGARSPDTLLYLACGLAVAIVADLGLRTLRGHLLGAMAGRLDFILGAEAFRHVLSLAPSLTERASVGAQVSRLREFESVREFFTGSLAAVALELPFVVLFIAVIALLGGPLALVPVVMILAFLLSGWLLFPGLNECVSAAGRARSERQAFLIETINNMRSIKIFSGEGIWRERYRTLSAGAAMANLAIARRSIALQTFAHVLMVAAGIGVMAMGTLRVLDGVMTVGALIATMMLVWRVLSPLQAGFLAFSRLTQVRQGVQQVNRLMRLAPERSTPRTAASVRKFAGGIEFAHVSFRYRSDADPALLGVSFSAEPGELIAVVGRNGSGKSTLLKLVAGLYQPQAGTVLVDGLDIRQLDPVELRRTIAYMPKTAHLFYGTIAQNLRLAAPTATDEQLALAAERAGVLDEINQLPEGFETRVGRHSQAQLPHGFGQELGLVRALLREAPIVLLDEPATALDDASDMALMDQLRRLRGRTTVIMVSHRPSHIRLADRAILLERGTIRYVGAPPDVLRQKEGLSL